jgi:hypothetical protein
MTAVLETSALGKRRRSGRPQARRPHTNRVPVLERST